MAWFRRLINLARADRVVRDIDREMAFHIAELIDELTATGMSAADARREAYRRFGHRGVLQERVRRVDVLGWLESLLADLRYATRALRTSKGFTAVAVLSLGLGIGANTAIFSLINAVMLRSLPVDHPEEIVQITMGGRVSFTNPLWEQIRDRARDWGDALTGFVAFSDHDYNLTDGGVIQRAEGAQVSGDYFNVLGVPAVAGRMLTTADDLRGCSGVAVLSHRFWQRQYGADPNAVGSTISLDGHAFEIVGVAAAGFSGIHVGRRADVFTPLCTVDMLGDRDMLDARSTWFIHVFGRLRSGSTLLEAQTQLASGARGAYEATVPQHWSADEQREYRERTLSAEPGAHGLSTVRGQYRDALFVLFVVVGVVLLIACANVAQLLLARATTRRHEISVRLALGSGRTRLVRQLLTESVFLALLGAAVGVVFARWSSGIVVALLSRGGDTVSLDLSIDRRVLGFTIVVAIVTGIVFALGPALRAVRVAPHTAMRGAGRGVVGTRNQRVARAIVTCQVALSLVLVVAAGLLVGSFKRLATIDPGFRSNGVLVVGANWYNVGIPTDEYTSYARGLLDRIRDIPAVRQASASIVTPINGSSWNENVVVDGITRGDSQDVLVWFNAVTDGFFDVLGTELLAGRDFDTRDRDGAPMVVMVNQTLARTFFGDAQPLGKRIRANNHGELGPLMEIVGVVEDAKYRRVEEETLPTAYVPLGQTTLWGPAVEIALSTDAPTTVVIPAVTAAMHELNPAIGLQFTTMDEQIAISLARPRLLATLSGFFGALALVLAMMGLYGTVSYNVASRRNEIGIRIALGAAQVGMLRMVAGEVGRVVIIGIVLGTVLALATSRLVAAFLYGVTPTDPVTLVLSAFALASAALLAGMVPAWRAAGVDPMVTLREN